MLWWWVYVISQYAKAGSTDKLLCLYLNIIWYLKLDALITTILSSSPKLYECGVETIFHKHDNSSVFTTDSHRSNKPALRWDRQCFDFDSFSKALYNKNKRPNRHDNMSLSISEWQPCVSACYLPSSSLDTVMGFFHNPALTALWTPDRTSQVPAPCQKTPSRPPPAAASAPPPVFRCPTRRSARLFRTVSTTCLDKRWSCWMQRPIHSGLRPRTAKPRRSEERIC